MHCMRLLFSGRHILEKGEPIVRFEAGLREYLMQVRHGEFKYDVIMERVDKEMATLEQAKVLTKLPWGADISKVNKLYQDVINWA